VRNFENPTNNPPNGLGVGIIPTNKQSTCVDATATTQQRGNVTAATGDQPTPLG